ncbi:MAG: alpha/beta hydrolase [Mycobacteriaceae bacterium]|nr:alpha/beta hydrolase [Mycobacteriaceae bacterium]MBV9639709.1 alpha/beta hydrolase [Mycobacteriaceae bacterium]
MSPNRRLPIARKAMTWTVVVATIVVATSCSRLVDGRPLMGQLRVGAPIGWGPCKVTPSDDTVKLPAGARCGKLAVPVDYSKPDGNSATMALVKFPATGAKIGSLIINPGGPGESGVQAAASMVDSLPPQIRERFDLVGFDPRGVANAAPAVWCNSDADNDRLRADPEVDYSPAGVAHIEQLTKEFVARCIDRMGNQFLENVGTANVARDLDTLRTALGDAKLTYLGYSYGTRIGSAYAEAYPENVRAMVLDGAVDPNADPIEANIQQAAAFQKAFNDYAADCAKAPDCPLGTDPGKAVDVYKSLVDPLVQKPAKTADPRQLAYSDAIVATILPLYSPGLWRHLTDGLTELKDGRGDTMLALADLYMGRDPRGHYTNSTDVRVAVNCVDQPPVTDRAKAIEQDRRTREVAPFMSYGDFTGDAPLDTCAFWPVPPTSKPHQIFAHGLPPVLVISTTHDPATPYQAGVDLARQLGGALLTFDGTQHTVALQGNSCVDAIVTRYLVDQTVPGPDARC